MPRRRPPCAVAATPSPSPSDSATVARVASGSDAAGAPRSSGRDTPSAAPAPPVEWAPTDGAHVLALTEFIAPAVLRAARSGELTFENRGRSAGDRASERGGSASPRAVVPPPAAPPPLALARLAAPPALPPPAKKKAKKGTGKQSRPPASGCLPPPTTPTQPPRPVCTFYMEGRCLRGAACEFAHAGVEPATRLVPCRYAARGECMKGPHCEFSHDAAAQEPCARLLLAGTCAFGADCRFAHGEWSESDRAALVARARRREAERAERGLKPTIGLEKIGVDGGVVSPPTQPVAPDVAAAAARADVLAGAAAARAPVSAPPAAADLLAGALASRE